MNTFRFPVASGIILITVGFLLSSCAAPASKPISSTSPAPVLSRSPSTPPPDFYHLPDQKRPRPYKVLGKWYQPMAHANGFMQQGLASWYGKDFHGNPTSSGEIYDMHGISAAHKTLPLHTWVRVVNLANRKSLVVRINDRGPFVAGRIIDLSYGAAVELGVAGPGTAPVEISALGRRPPGKERTDFRVAAAESSLAVPAPTPSSPSDSPLSVQPLDFSGMQYRIQVGAFGKKESAEEVARKLKQYHGAAAVKPIRCSRSDRLLYRVLVGNYTSLDEAEQHEISLRQQGYDGAFAVAD